MHGGLSWLLIAALAGLLGLAAWLDWRSRTISNWLNGAIALLALPFWYANGLDPWPGVAMQIGVAAGVLAIFALAFRFGFMGGGDVKMLAALALWLPLGSLVQLLAIMSLAGGVVTLAVAIPHRIAKTAGKPEIPYGIAISFAGFWLIGERILNQFV
jgi:prepilin peptidase CpaA